MSGQSLSACWGSEAKELSGTEYTTNGRVSMQASGQLCDELLQQLALTHHTSSHGSLTSAHGLVRHRACLSRFQAVR